MWFKRQHTKSRNPCEQCRERQINCDEGCPPCTDCIRPPECSRQRSTSPNEIVMQLNPAYSTQQLLTFDPDLDSRQSLIPPSPRLRELELMHQWCTKTCHSFHPKHSGICQNEVVAEGLKHECVMQAILAFSSAHIAYTIGDPVAAAPYVHHALESQAEAMSSLHSALHDLSPSRCGAIFTSAMITMASAIVLPLLPRVGHDQDGTVPSLESVSHLYEFLKGITSVVDASRHWLEDGPFKAVFGAQFDLHSSLSEAECSPLLQLLRRSNDRFHRTNPTRHQVYQRAIERLGVLLSTDRFRAFQWLLDSDAGIMDELRAKEPMALILFLHWGSFLQRLHGLWWAQYLGERLVSELSDLLV